MSPNPAPNDNTGGRAAVRGCLVQTLVGLLDITQDDPPFFELTLEPGIAHQQFDYVWISPGSRNAVQVKSTINSFRKADVVRWAEQLAAAKSIENCRLILVGSIPPALAKVSRIGDVLIETRNLDLQSLLEQASHRLAQFLEAEGQNAGTAEERMQIVYALIAKLEHFAITGQSLTRAELVQLLVGWVRTVPIGNVKVDLSHFEVSKYAPRELLGRKRETQRLSKAWSSAVHKEDLRPKVLTFVALGGEGKTSLVAKWAAELAHEGWSGCENVFAWSFYSQGTREKSTTSSDAFLAAALSFFGDVQDREFAGSNAGAFEKGQRLATLVGNKCNVLILDGLEPLQYAPSSPTPGELKDPGLVALLNGLAIVNQGLCVVTTRYEIADLIGYHETTAPMVQLRPLPTQAGVTLLHRIGVVGEKAELKSLVARVRGHALTLQVLGQFLVRSFAGDVRRVDEVKLRKADAKIQGGHAFRVMASYEKWLGNDSVESRRELALLRVLGLFDRPASAGCLNELRRQPIVSGLTDALTGISDEEWEFCLTSLSSTKLVTVLREQYSGEVLALDTHPLIREYFSLRLREDDQEAHRIAHKRLFEYLRTSTTEGEQPTLEDLQPLFQAVAHGCQAGLFAEAMKDVYQKRILRGIEPTEFYSWKVLGAVGSNLSAIAQFFQKPWSTLPQEIDRADQAWLYNEAGNYLRGLGRLRDSAEPFAQARKMAIAEGDWLNSAVYSYNLAELKLITGQIQSAVDLAKEGVDYANRSGDWIEQRDELAALANALFNSGELEQASDYFEASEKVHSEHESACPYLVSLPGFQYCELLVDKAEHLAWQCTMMHGAMPRADASVLDSIVRVSERSARTLAHSEASNRSLLSIALDNLTMGRSALFAHIIRRGAANHQQVFGNSTFVEFSDPYASTEQILLKLDKAVSLLRRSGQIDDLPRGLLSRAWARTFSNSQSGTNGAKADLDEAWQIAQRGPMPLFLVDVLMYRLRLFGREIEYPWGKRNADLSSAVKLTKKCGYRRRNQELIDLQDFILSL